MGKSTSGADAEAFSMLHAFKRTRTNRGLVAGYADAVPFGELGSQEHLVVERVYCGGSMPGHGADPLRKLIPRCSNEGGFRAIGARTLEGAGKERCRVLVLSSSGADPDWPDRLDAETGDYIYYGDNKSGGRDLHNTSKSGNLLLSHIFAREATFEGRASVPPILVFQKTGTGRDTRFLGLAVPTSLESDGLVAIWRQTKGIRFQNYKAKFRIIDCGAIPLEWLRELAYGSKKDAEVHAPAAWKKWVKTGKAKPLHAPKTIEFRVPSEQLPDPTDRVGCRLLDAIRARFIESPHDFEFVAAEIFKLIEPRVYDLEVTRKSRDHGRDAVGRLRVGGEQGESDGVLLEFALEAKAWAPSHGLGVKETSRLISRLRHRQFGVIVTTSYVSPQAYQEIREDAHPVIIITARDISQILRARGIASAAAVDEWISRILGTEPRRT